MSIQAQEFKNDNLTVTMSRSPGCKIKLEILVSPSATQAARVKALKNINKEVNIPGFRKGKAPESLVLKRFGTHIDQEWHEVIINTSVGEGLNLSKTQPLSGRKIARPTVDQCSQEEGAKLIVEFECEPVIPEIDIDSIQLEEVERSKVTEADIEETIESIRYQQAKWEPVLDRPNQEGDFIDLDIETVEQPPRKLVTDGRFLVKEGKMAGWIYRLIKGLSTGETSEGMSEWDNSQGEKQPADFKPTQCRLTLKGINHGVIPALDDAFAKQGGCENIADLNNKVMALLEQRSIEAVHTKLRQQVEEFLIKNYEFDLPESLLDLERKIRTRNKIRALKQHQESEQSIMARSSEIEAIAMKEAVRFMRLLFLTRMLAAKFQSVVTKDEVIAEYSAQIWNIPTELSIIENTMEPDEIRSRLFMNVMSRKVLDQIVQQKKS